MNARDSKPLRGAAVVITRPEGRSEQTAQAFETAGALVEVVPVTRIETDFHQDEIERALDELAGKNGWLILPSPTAIQIYLKNFGVKSGFRVAVVGNASAALLKQAGLDVFTPPESNGRSLAETLPANPDDSVLIAGSELSREELSERLEKRGIHIVRRVTLYRPVPDATQLERLQAMLGSPLDPDQRMRIIVVSAPSAIDAIAKMMNDKLWRAAAWLAIGPTTMARLKAALPAGARAAQSVSPDSDGLVRAAAALMENA